MAHCRSAGRCIRLAHLQIGCRNSTLHELPWVRHNSLRGICNTSRLYLKDGRLKDSLNLPSELDVTKNKAASSYPGPGPAPKAPFTSEGRDVGRGFAFVFDCDGVLFAGSSKIPDAKPALRLVEAHDVRCLFLTNGGGDSSEKAKANSLRQAIGFPNNEDIFTGRVIQSHTPMLNWPDHVKKNDTVFVTSKAPEKARRVAEGYGFKNVVTSADILHEIPEIYPFDPPEKSRSRDPDTVRPLPNGVKVWSSEAGNGADYDEAELRSGNYLKIDHVLAWNDPRDWSVDTQIIYDLLMSHEGYLGTMSRKNGDQSLPNKGYQQDGQPQVWFSNLDLLWKTEYHINRFGTGAFLGALKGVWSTVTDTELQFQFMGKPSKITYDYAHDRLLRYNGATAENASQGRNVDYPRLKRVYMVGDNPESDVRGALEYSPEDGTEWVPILVRTGVWKETEVQPEPKYKPATTVDNVLDAVIWGMRNEGIEVDRRTLKLQAADLWQDSE